MTKTNPKIPEGWSVKKLGELSSFKSGGTPDKNKPEYWNGSIPWISASSMRGFVYKDSNEKISEIGLKNGSNCVHKGDLLILVRGSMLWNRIPVGIAANLLAFNQDVKGIFVKSDIKPYFLLYWFYANEQKIKNMVVGTGIGAGKLETDELKNLDILLPPLPEQEKIAEILGCWNNGIEKLSRLIEEKKRLKKGLMQRLLSGKQRLLGFSDPWKKVKLSDVCDVSKGSQLGKLEMIDNGTFPVMNGGIIPSGLTDSFNEPENTITISEGGNSCGFVSLMKEKFWCGGHCYALKNLKANLLFLFQILKSKENAIMKLRVGSGLPNIQKTSIEKFSFHIPTAPLEQKAIADILSKADEEITLLTEKLSALKSQKKGLMQKLLTGQIRVKVS